MLHQLCAEGGARGPKAPPNNINYSPVISNNVLIIALG